MLLGMRSTLLSSVFTPASLFASGEQGAWYDPSDFSTLFQDSAGTTPVTAVEQAVGRMLDKSGRGNHASQATPTARPIVSARVNLLTKTEQFDDAVWVKKDSTATTNTAIAPDGTSTADKVIPNAVGTTHYVHQTITKAATSITYRLIKYVKADGYDYGNISAFGSVTGNQVFALFDLVAGTISTPGTNGTGFTAIASSISNVGSGWFKLTLDFTSNADAVINPTLRIDSVYNTPTYAGNGTSGILVWGADLRVANDGIGIPAYQRVNTSTDYDTTGFPVYLRFDGSDDSMATGSINFSATDKMSVFAGVRKNNDSGFGTIAETSTNSDVTNGTFIIYRFSTSSYFGVNSRGTILAGTGTSNSAYAAPYSAVQTGISDISGDNLVLRLNGAQVSQSTADQGSGNYGNYPLYIGSRAGTTARFNGRLYSLIIRGSASTNTQIINTETYVNQKTGAF